MGALSLSSATLHYKEKDSLVSFSCDEEAHRPLNFLAILCYFPLIVCVCVCVCELTAINHTSNHNKVIKLAKRKQEIENYLEKRVLY